MNFLLLFGAIRKLLEGAANSRLRSALPYGQQFADFRLQAIGDIGGRERKGRE